MFFQATAHVIRSANPRSSVPSTKSSPETWVTQYGRYRAHTVKVGIIFQQSNGPYVDLIFIQNKMTYVRLTDFRDTDVRPSGR